MMRVRVHIVVSALVLASCRSNPAFHVIGERTDESGDTGATSSDGETSTGERVCEPTHREPANVCAPGSKYVPLYYLTEFTVAEEPMLVDRECTDTSEILVKRVGQQLHACTRCDQPCDAALSMDVGFPAMTALLAPLLPAEGECAWLWHLGAPNPDPATPDAPQCLTAGFALADADASKRMRVAVAFNHQQPDPFAAVADSPFSVAVTDQSLGSPCPDITDTRCEDGGYVPKQLSFSFGDCTFDTYQGVITHDIRVDDLDYILETHSAYDCVTGPTMYRWWLRRE
jgi:hypothetical protein